jgi:hypothetical protein
MAKKKLKNRIIVLITKEEPERLFVGSSAAEIARRYTINGKPRHERTLAVAALKAELSSTRRYENSHYTVRISDEFIKGKTHNGNFSKL